MAAVVLGRAGDTVVVDLDVCAKTGRATGHRVRFRGSTMPGWVVVLLLFTVVGFLLASTMTSRRYVVTVPLAASAHARWRRYRRVALLVALGGAAALVVAVTAPAGGYGLWAGAGVVLIVGAFVGAEVNGAVNGLGFRTTRDGDLVLTRAHPAFAQAVAAASVEPVPR